MRRIPLSPGLERGMLPRCGPIAARLRGVAVALAVTERRVARPVRDRRPGRSRNMNQARVPRLSCSACRHRSPIDSAPNNVATVSSSAPAPIRRSPPRPSSRCRAAVSVITAARSCTATRPSRWSGIRGRIPATPPSTSSSTCKDVATTSASSDPSVRQAIHTPIRRSTPTHGRAGNSRCTAAAV